MELFDYGNEIDDGNAIGCGGNGDDGDEIDCDVLAMMAMKTYLEQVTEPQLQLQN